jgi:hypothetical protein
MGNFRQLVARNDRSLGIYRALFHIVFYEMVDFIGGFPYSPSISSLPFPSSEGSSISAMQRTFM